MNNTLLTQGVFLLLTCCGPTFDQQGSFEQFGMPKKLEHYRHLEGKAFAHADTATFVILDNQELKNAIQEIGNADNPESWKGAGWDQIKLYFTDTVLYMNTNNKKIGLRASGTFYDLENENFITIRMGQVDGSR